MVEKEELKQTAFRLPKRTLDILDRIIKEGKARNRTDALILAIDASGKYIFTDDGNVMERLDEHEKKIETIKRELDAQKEYLEDEIEVISILKDFIKKHPEKVEELYFDVDETPNQ